jgi:NAD(P)-dependent dehydrogenase (short-subunit alcohol dehydrogenase family)
MHADFCNLRGRVALVTGGGAGIGRAIVEAYAALGASVVVAEIDATRLEDVGRWLATHGKENGVDHWATRADVREDGQVAAVVAGIEQRFGGLDVLVNNVGDFLLNIKPFEQTAPEEWDALYSINLRHVFAVTRATIPLLRRAQRGASIINVSTIEAFRGIPCCAVYSAFKSAITGFTKSLALELGPAGIRVNAIAPETTETEQVKPSLFIQPQYREHIPRWIPLGRFGLPSDVAGCAVFLATDLSAWVTGTTLHVDGGALAAGGFYRTPQGQWTNVPVVSDNGVAF